MCKCSWIKKLCWAWYLQRTIEILAGAEKIRHLSNSQYTPSHRFFFFLFFLFSQLSSFLLQDVCISCGLVATAAITFVIMFLPKGRQLSAMGRDGVYAEDRTDVYTGSSSTQSTGKITLFRAIIFMQSTVKVHIF